MTAPNTQVTSLLTQFGLTTAAEELVPRLTEAGHSPACALVPELLGAKRDLDLPRALRKPDLFEAILLDDLGLRPGPDGGVPAVHDASRY